jgi:hypothetical protein
VILLYNVINKTKYLSGIILLIIYYLGSLLISLENLQSLWLLFIGQVLLILFFTKSVYKELIDINLKTNNVKIQ